MKSATIYNYNDLLLFVVNYRYSDGLVRNTAQISVFNESECSDILTQALIKCFDNFKTEITLEPDSNKTFKSKICKKAGLSKYNDFLKGSNVIEFADFGNEVKLQPLKSATTFKGYESFHGIVETYNKDMLEENCVIQAALKLFEEMKHEADCHT